MTPPQQLPRLIDLRSKEMIELQFLFAHQASTIQEAARNFLNGNRAPGVPDTLALHGLCTDYITKAAVLADKLQLHTAEDEGTEAWSGSASTEQRDTVPGPCAVPVPHAFQRILDDLQQAPPTLGEVDAALHRLQLNDSLNNDSALQRPSSPTMLTPGPLDQSFVNRYKEARRPSNQTAGATGAAGMGAHAPNFGEGIPAPNSNAQEPDSGTPTSGGKAPVEAPEPELVHDVLAPVPRSEELQQASNKSGAALLDCLFINPAPPLLHHDDMLRDGTDALHKGTDAPPPSVPSPPPKRQRRRRVFDMSTEFLAMFQGPLPDYIVAALTSAFNLDDDGAEELDEVLVAVAGDAIEDLQDEANTAQMQAQVAVP
ncbi:unnamed protein product [Urochloa humidicola]